MTEVRAQAWSCNQGEGRDLVDTERQGAPPTLTQPAATQPHQGAGRHRDRQGPEVSTGNSSGKAELTQDCYKSAPEDMATCKLNILHFLRFDCF